ncbi:echinoderm microtubule-associated protein-like 6 isoform X2 [Engystomops pustulosus]|uniref:echinoderm microtubule-associated protein-like 6 isoform X2 n=1 Tax=Engystomops pustulosus TaxID=76066 RepID=UPI003AFB3319
MSGMLVTPKLYGVSSRSSAQLITPEETPDTREDTPEPSTEGDLRLEREIDCGEEVMSCRFNPSGSLLAVGLLTGIIKVFSVPDGIWVHTLKDEQSVAQRLPVTALRFHPCRPSSKGDLLLATYAGGQVKFWHISTQSCVRSLREDRQTLAITFSPSASHFLTAGSSDEILVYDTETMTCVNICQPSPSLSVMDGHRSRIFGLTFHPLSEEYFISGGWDDTVQFWDIRQKRSYRRISGPHVCGDALDIDPDTEQILIGSWRKEENLQVWDSETGQKILTVPDDFRGPSRVYSCRWLGAGHMIAAGSDLNMCRIIDRHSTLTRGSLVDLPGGVYSLDVSPPGPPGAPLIAVTSSHRIFLLRPTGSAFS